MTITNPRQLRQNLRASKAAAAPPATGSESPPPHRPAGHPSPSSPATNSNSIQVPIRKRSSGDALPASPISSPRPSQRQRTSSAESVPPRPSSHPPAPLTAAAAPSGFAAVLAQVHQLEVDSQTRDSQLAQERQISADLEAQLSTARAEKAAAQSDLHATKTELANSERASAHLNTQHRNLIAENGSLLGKLEVAKAKSEADQARALAAETGRAEQAASDGEAVKELQARLDAADEKLEDECTKHIKSVGERNQLAVDKRGLEGQLEAARAAGGASEARAQAAQAEGRRLEGVVKEKEKELGEERDKVSEAEGKVAEMLEAQRELLGRFEAGK